MNIDQLIRAHLSNWVPYTSARETTNIQADIWLDANENPFESEFNRYPDPHQIKLKQELAILKQVSIDRIFLGNGSDEAIDLLIRVFCEPGKDKILICPPTYGMYQVASRLSDVEVIKIPLTESFQLDMLNVKKALSTNLIKLIFVCSPNNPTGNCLKEDDLLELAQYHKGLLIVDEAYIDFAQQTSLVPMLDQFSNLVVLQTFSKAWGLAGVRLGLAFGHPEVVRILSATKPPYNISSVTQRIVVRALKNRATYRSQLNLICHERSIMEATLQRIKGVNRVYPSSANFLLVNFDQPLRVYEHLKQNGLVVRDRTREVEGCLRITVGTEIENNRLIKLLSQL